MNKVIIITFLILSSFSNSALANTYTYSQKVAASAGGTALFSILRTDAAGTKVISATSLVGTTFTYSGSAVQNTTGGTTYLPVVNSSTAVVSGYQSGTFTYTISGVDKDKGKYYPFTITGNILVTPGLPNSLASIQLGGSVSSTVGSPTKIISNTVDNYLNVTSYDTAGINYLISSGSGTLGAVSIDGSNLISALFTPTAPGPYSITINSASLPGSPKHISISGIAVCGSGLHVNPTSSICDSDVITIQVANGSATQTWAGTDYGSPVIVSCNAGFVSVNSSCISPIKRPSTLGLHEWYDADKISSLNSSQSIIVSDGAAVKSWADLNLPTNSAFQPTYKTNALNGYPYVNFTAANGSNVDGLINSSFSNTTGSYTVALAGLFPPSSQTWGTLFGSNGPNLAMDLEYGHIGSYINGWFFNIYDPNTATDGSKFSVITVSADSANNILRGYFNDTVQMPVDLNYATASGKGLSILQGLTMGGSGGKVAEVLVYDRALSDTESHDLNKYLIKKYTDPTLAKGSPLANAIFNLCSAGKHLDPISGNCADDLLSCQLEGAINPQQHWFGSSYSTCIASSCIDSYVLDQITGKCLTAFLPPNGIAAHLNVDDFTKTNAVDGQTIDSWKDPVSGASFDFNSSGLGGIIKPYYSSSSSHWGNKPVVVMPSNSLLSWSPPAAINLNWTLITGFATDPVGDTCVIYGKIGPWQPSLSFSSGSSSNYAGGFLTIYDGIDWTKGAFLGVTQDATNGIFAYPLGYDAGIPWYRGAGQSTPILNPNSMTGLTLNLASQSSGNCYIGELVFYDHALTHEEMTQVKRYMSKHFGSWILQGN